MLIRVECVCGTRFKFDLDDSLKRMPGPVHCPKCNHDCTALADANLTSQLEAANVPAPAAAPTAPAAHAPISLSIKGHAPSPQAPAPAISIKPTLPSAPAAGSPTPNPTTAPADSSAPKPMAPPVGGGSLRVGGGHAAPAAAPTTPATPATPPPAVSAAPSAVVPPSGGSSLRVGGGHAAPSAAPTTPPPAPSAPAPAGQPAPETPVAAAPTDPEYLCPKHAGQETVAFCAVCNKRICPICMESFGYVCSAYCQEQGRARKMDIPIYAGQRVAKMENVRKGDMGILRAVGAGALLLILLVAFFNLYLAKPRSAYVVESNKSAPYVATRWLNDETIVTLAGTHLSAHKSSSGTELWSADLPSEDSTPKPVKAAAPAPKLAANAKPSFDDSFFESSYTPRPEMMVRGSDVWIVTTTKAIDYDLTTGSKKKEVKWPQPAESIHLGSESITAIARPDRTGTPLMRIDPANGNAQTVLLPINTAEIIAERRAWADRAGEHLQASSLQDLMPNESGFRAGGAGLVQFKTRMLEQRLQEAVVTIRGPGLIDNQNLRSSQHADAAREFLNQSKREKTIDGSLYQVTLRRFFGGSDWTGQIIGRPSLHSTKSADIIIGGTNMVVLARGGAKMWETKLAYELGDRSMSFGDDDDDSSSAPKASPVLEVGSRLLVADAGTIHCYDLKTGAVQWRLNTVGDKQMQFDGLGNIYVATTTASPESIKFEGGTDLDNNERPQILKIELASGKQLWKSNDLGDNVYVSGKFVYATRGRISMVARMQADNNLTEPVVNYRIHRLDASTGREKWEYHRKRAPQNIEVVGNHLLLTYRNQIQMLKFTSF